MINKYTSEEMKFNSLGIYQHIVSLKRYIVILYAYMHCACTCKIKAYVV